MPELPEVETVVRSIRPQLLGKTITNAWLDWERSLVVPDASGFLSRIQNQRVQDVWRRAKYIVIKLSHDYLMIHLKMTGRLYVTENEAQHDADRWVHFRFQFDDGQQLRFSDARKFGRVYLTNDLAPYLGQLGPEPLSDDFSLDWFGAAIRKRKTVVKNLLLNQTFIAGIGNIYADEALHRAHIRPTRKTDTLNATEIADLHEAIRWVLEKGIERQGASIGWYRQPDGTKGSMQDDFFAYGRTGASCRTCQQGIIEKTTVGQRGTHFCPNCQH